MCLDKVKRNRYKPTDEVKCRKRINTRIKNRWLPPIYDEVYPKGLPYNKWIKDESSDLIMSDHVVKDDYKMYPSGFHCYLDPNRDSIYEVQFRRYVDVKVRNIVAVGVQDGQDVVVAKEIFVINPKTKKKVRKS